MLLINLLVDTVRGVSMMHAMTAGELDAAASRDNSLVSHSIHLYAVKHLAPFLAATARQINDRFLMTKSALGAGAPSMHQNSLHQLLRFAQEILLASARAPLPSTKVYTC